MVVEELRELIERLVRERQQLRNAGASRRRLEANRCEVVLGGCAGLIPIRDTPSIGPTEHHHVREVDVMTASDRFTKLKEQVEKAERRVNEAGSQDKAQLQAKVDEARKNADDLAADLHARTRQASQAEGQWQEVRSDWDQHIKRIRERIDAKKAAHDARVAEEDAEWAEADALDAIDFASSAVEEAEYAVLDAMLARKDADVLAASS
jgi:small-conductance mechanosensitive channel